MKTKALLLTTLLALSAAPLFAADGKAVFEAKCKMCHGAALEKKAIDVTKSDEVLVKFLLTEAKHKTRVADEATAKALVAYIKTLKK
jgi:cytochrome c